MPTKTATKTTTARELLGGLLHETNDPHLAAERAAHVATRTQAREVLTWGWAELAREIARRQIVVMEASPRGVPWQRGAYRRRLQTLGFRNWKEYLDMTADELYALADEYDAKGDELKDRAALIRRDADELVASNKRTLREMRQ